MTCVIASTWHPFTDSTSWSPMNPDVQNYHYGLERQTSQGYTSSGSESRKPLGKKRASRAGTRSVSTLSAAQLERKRANDREAQRAIRQRTKDHIESLEKEIGDLRESNESPPHMPPQNEFQAMAVSSPSTYQVASQQAPPHLSHQQPYHTPQGQHAYAQGYSQQPAYQIPSVQVPPPSAEYPTSESQLPPAPLPHPTYGQPSHEHQQYASQPPATTQAQVSYREDGRGYPLSHYPTA
ncbi:hypothetical protein KC353_g14569 [Hortaea werneckii]|nr:hypothetical protein KC353_g14569 [Hortaea werneckii]